MKWKNRGHEFDELGEYYKQTKIIYLYGARPAAKPILEQIEYAIKKANQQVLDVDIKFVDRDLTKQKQLFLGKEVISPEEFREQFLKNHGIVVLCMNENSTEEVSKSLETHNMQRKFHVYSVYEFYRYLSLFVCYRYQKLYLHIVDMFVSTYCNLNCEHCCVRTYQGIRKRRTVPEIKENIDEMFRKIDYVGIMIFGIGEGFMGGSPLESALEYITEKYADRFCVIEIVTNGTIVPKDSLIKVLQNRKIRVVVDDYTDHVQLAAVNYPLVTKCLSENDVQFSGLKREYWEEYEFGNVADDNIESLDKKLGDCICHAKGFAYIGYGNASARIYSCVHQTINAYQNIVTETEDDGIDLNSSDPLEIIEFLLGYTEKGYLSACTQCNGAFEGKESNHIPVAVQIEP